MSRALAAIGNHRLAASDTMQSRDKSRIRGLIGYTALEFGIVPRAFQTRTTARSIPRIGRLLATENASCRRLPEQRMESLSVLLALL